MTEGNDACKIAFQLIETDDFRDLSIESLALMMLLANVCAGGRYLVIDETGILTAAILERGNSDRERLI